MKISIVLGLGFGDEGKGRTVSYLVSKSKSPIVIRFNGGHQAGHNVVTDDGKQHIFSNFGSGTLQGAPTYWSKNCTFYPSAILKELSFLKIYGIKPILYVHPMCPVVTPYDIIHNQKLEAIAPNGSVGVGFGSTIARQEMHYKLHVMDLKYPTVLKEKVDRIRQFRANSPTNAKGNEQLDQYLRDILNLINSKDIELIIEPNIFDFIRHYDHFIFEGAGGIMLDMDHGFFPNVTRSNCTSKNAIEMIPNSHGQFIDMDIYYVTRSYLTRHGKGFMGDEECELKFNNIYKETNTTNKYQGKFRTGHLNIEFLNYALMCDNIYSGRIRKYKNLVITSLDQYELDINELRKKLIYGFEKIYTSRSPVCSELVCGYNRKENSK